MSPSFSNGPNKDPDGKNPASFGPTQSPSPLRLVPPNETTLDPAGELLLELHAGGRNIFSSPREALESKSLHTPYFASIGLVDFALNYAEERTEAWHLLYWAERQSSVIAAAALTSIENHPAAARAFRFLNELIYHEPQIAAFCAPEALGRKDAALVHEALLALTRYDIGVAQRFLQSIDPSLERDTAIAKQIRFILDQPPVTHIRVPPETTLSTDIAEAKRILTTERSFVWPPTNPNMIVPIAFRFLCPYSP
jgi:hypothetical protein